MVKENSSSSESLPKEERFVINMSSELIAYLCTTIRIAIPTDSLA